VINQNVQGVIKESRNDQVRTSFN